MQKNKTQFTEPLSTGGGGTNEPELVMQPLAELVSQVSPSESSTATPNRTETAATMPSPSPEVPVPPSREVASPVAQEALVENPLTTESESTQEQEVVETQQRSEEAPLPSRPSQPRDTQQLPVVPEQQVQAIKSATRHKIEEVLAEGLSDVYAAMTPQERQAFRQKGEEVAGAIEEMMSNFRATTRKMLKLIRSWLELIPRVNKYFLEQESKLKTDDMMKLQRKLKKERRNSVDIPQS